jgi:hypothetical protein
MSNKGIIPSASVLLALTSTSAGIPLPAAMLQSDILIVTNIGITPIHVGFSTQGTFTAVVPAGTITASNIAVTPVAPNSVVVFDTQGQNFMSAICQLSGSTSTVVVTSAVGNWHGGG